MNTNEIRKAIIRAASNVKKAGGMWVLADIKDYIENNFDISWEQAAAEIKVMCRQGWDILPEENQKTLKPRHRDAAISYGGQANHYLIKR